MHSSKKLVFNREEGKAKALDGVFLNHPVHILLCAFVVLCHQLSQIMQMGNGRELPLPQKNDYFIQSVFTYVQGDLLKQEFNRVILFSFLIPNHELDGEKYGQDDCRR